ncbi:MAG: UDP-glucuronate 4-epimerase [Pirellulaceae bacterium]|jgi:UDP-glucuronate 4-epimerase
MASYLITGAAGFIGFHVSLRLLRDGHDVFGMDNLNDYYDVQLKKDRLSQLQADSRFSFQLADISDRRAVEEVFATRQFDVVVNLAAQPGVRYSLENPHAYINSNIVGFLNVLEGCRHNDIGHLVYASSSSVYGANTKLPFSTEDRVDHPVSLYAATKKSNELLAHSYSYTHGVPTSGLRFFTVYGPWGRPDMALFKFTDAIISGRPIEVYNHGKMKRDFTYVDDICEGIVRIAKQPPGMNPLWTPEEGRASESSAPYRVYNIGNSETVELMTFIEMLEKHLNVTGNKKFMDMQPGDVTATYADIEDFAEQFDYRPKVSVDEGISKFVQWYRAYYSK